MKRSLAVLFPLLLSACAEAAPNAAGVPGSILPGATAADSAVFARGRTLFHREFTAADGLGPLFNQARCSSCHDLPAIGGMGTEFVQKATRFENGRCDLLIEQGGDMIQARSTDALRAHGILADPVPREANAFSPILPPALFGAGLMEAIAEDEIRAGADPDDRDGDGISGRTGEAFDRRLGRFGRKATFATVRSFVESAALGEMGLTSPGDTREERPGGRPLPDGVDPRPEPELSHEEIALLTGFVRLLAAPEPAATEAADRRLFEEIGCAACHRPTFTTSSRDPLFDRKRIALYSDLLLHDMGQELATVCSPHAAPSEWRTTPLMGLRYRQRFLHDGRSQTLESAIEAHGGEAAAARRRFGRLTGDERARLLRFLRAL